MSERTPLIAIEHPYYSQEISGSIGPVIVNLLSDGMKEKSARFISWDKGNEESTGKPSLLNALDGNILGLEWNSRNQTVFLQTEEYKYQIFNDLQEEVWCLLYKGTKKRRGNNTKNTPNTGFKILHFKPKNS